MKVNVVRSSFVSRCPVLLEHPRTARAAYLHGAGIRGAVQRLPALAGSNHQELNLRHLFVEAASHYQRSYAPIKTQSVGRRAGMAEALTADTTHAERRLARKFGVAAPCPTTSVRTCGHGGGGNWLAPSLRTW